MAEMTECRKCGKVMYSFLHSCPFFLCYGGPQTEVEEDDTDDDEDYDPKWDDVHHGEMIW